VVAVSAEGVFSDPKLAPFGRRFYPHLFDGEGQFLAIFRRKGEKCPLREKKVKKKKQEKKDPVRECGEKFLSETLFSPPEGRLVVRGNEIYLAPSHPFDDSIFSSPGVLVGEERKGRIVPHHRFFLSFASKFQNKVSLPLGDERIEAYLRGEEISVEGEDGWAVLFCEKTPLGGIRIHSGTGKNHYPKGLRKV
jgi:NOL1/NOP2/fmu family ribosome biogenesis protein